MHKMGNFRTERLVALAVLRLVDRYTLNSLHQPRL